MDAEDKGTKCSSQPVLSAEAASVQERAAIPMTQTMALKSTKTEAPDDVARESRSDPRCEPGWQQEKGSAGRTGLQGNRGQVNGSKNLVQDRCLDRSDSGGRKDWKSGSTRVRPGVTWRMTLGVGLSV